MELHASLGMPISEEFTDFTKPEYPGISEDLFSGIKKNYKEEVLNSVTDIAEEHKEEVYKLANLMLPHLQTVLARQRRDYGIDEESFEMDFPVFDQAAKIDETPVHNIGMERQCGKVDYRLKKYLKLPAVSRSIILQRSKQLREGELPYFRGFKEAAKAKLDKEYGWLESQKQKFKEGADQKEEVAQRNERRRLDMLDKLKSNGGPFTDSREVEIFLEVTNLDDRAKQQRLKLEIQFARESSTLLPSVDPIFKIMKTQPNGKRKMKTAHEFGEALMSFLGKRSDRTMIEYNKFQETLNRLSV